MIDIYVREFIGIGNFLEKNAKVHKGYILAEKKTIEEMLNRNRYDTASNKLKIWKRLRWIDTEADRRLTKRVYDGESGTYKPYIKMSISVLEQLRALQKQAK